MLEILFTNGVTPNFTFDMENTCYAPIPVGIKGHPYFPKGLQEHYKDLYAQYVNMFPNLEGGEGFYTAGYNKFYVCHPLLFIHGETKEKCKAKIFYFIETAASMNKNMTILFNLALYRAYFSDSFIITKEFTEQYGTIDEFDLAGIYGSTELFETDLEIFMEQNNITNRVIIIDGSIPKQTSLVDDLTSNLE